MSDSEQSEEGGQGADQPSVSPEAGNIWPEGEPLPIPSEFAPTESTKEYHAVNGQELMDLLSIESNLDLSDSVIYLDGGDYEIFDIYLGECNNLSIIGTGDTHIYSTSGSETIFYAYNCNNLLLCGLVMGPICTTDPFLAADVISSNTYATSYYLSSTATNINSSDGSNHRWHGFSLCCQRDKLF